MRRAEPGRLAPFLLPLVAGALLRLVGLTRDPLWVDEIMTLQSASVGEPFLLRDVLINPQGPLPQVLLRGWIALAGAGDLSLRLWAAVGSMLGLVAAVWVFRLVVPRAALLATWLLALSPFQVWYSHEVRNYAWLFGAALLALGAFVVAERRPTPARWLGHGFAVAAAALCNLSALFLIPAFGLGALRGGRRRVLGWAGATAVGLLLVSPWVVVTVIGHVDWSGVVQGAPAGEPIRGGRLFDLFGPPSAYAAFLGGYGLGPPLRAVHAGLSPRAWIAYVPELLLGLAAVGLALVGAWRGRRETRAGLLALVAFAPLVILTAVALVGLKPFNARYLAASQPAFLALLAVGTLGWTGRGRFLGRGTVVAILLVMALGWGRQTFDSRYAKEDFRSAAKFLTEAAGPDDLILQQGVEGPLARYYRGRASIATYYPVFFRGADAGRGRLRSMIAGRRRVWWVGSRLWYEDPDRRLLGWLESAGTPEDRRSWTGVDLVEVAVGDSAR